MIQLARILMLLECCFIPVLANIPVLDKVNTVYKIVPKFATPLIFHTLIFYPFNNLVQKSGNLESKIVFVSKFIAIWFLLLSERVRAFILRSS